MKHTFFHFVILALGLLGLCGCSDPPVTNDSISSLHDTTYIGEGSFWEWDLDTDGSFTATQKATINSDSFLLQVKGTYQAFDSGFHLFTVGSSSDSVTCNGCTSAPSSGDTAVGVSSPGIFLATAPLGGGDTNPLIMAATGSCPSTTAEVKWINAKTGDGGSNDLESSQFWGTLEIPLAGGVIADLFQLDKTTTQDQTIKTTTGCTDGTFGSESSLTSVVNSLNYGLVEIAADDFVFVMPKDSTAIQADTLDERVYVGLLFRENPTDGTNIRSVRVTFDTSGNATYQFMDSIQNDTLTSTSGSLVSEEIGADTQEGFVRFSATTSDSKSASLWGGFVQSINGSGRSLLFLSGYITPTNQESISFFLIQK